MTKKDYIAIARVLKIARDNFREDGEGKAVRSRDYILDKGAESAIGIVAEALTYVFAEDNNRFDRARFLKACGIVECGLLDPESEVCDLENCNHPLLK